MVYDVIVVGGGISGAVAAISAGRAGAKVLLIERSGYLGGTLTASGVGPMMTFHAGETQVVRGITDEVIQRLVAKDLSPGHIFDTTGYTYTVTPFDPEGLKHELELMVREAGGVILYHTMLAGVETKDKEIKEIKICNKQGLSTISGKVYIDATGDADLSAWAGVPFVIGREGDGKAQPMSMMLRVNNVDVKAVRDYIKSNNDEFPRLEGNPSIVDKSSRLSIGGFVKTLEKARKAGDITFQREDVLFFETNALGEFIINTSRILGYSNLKPEELSLAETAGRQQAWELLRFFRKYIPGFEDAKLLFIGPEVGVRSSRQICGLYTLSLEDLHECKTFDNGIAYSGYPVDVHSPDGTSNEKYEENHREENRAFWGKTRSMPYSCLVNEKIDNIITVGRCVSVSFWAQGAFRTAPIAGSIGHAGGAAAAIAAKKGISLTEVDIKELHKLLIQQGAYIKQLSYFKCKRNEC